PRVCPCGQHASPRPTARKNSPATRRVWTATPPNAGQAWPSVPPHPGPTCGRHRPENTAWPIWCARWSAPPRTRSASVPTETSHTRKRGSGGSSTVHGRTDTSTCSSTRSPRNWPAPTWCGVVGPPGSGAVGAVASWPWGRRPTSAPAPAAPPTPPRTQARSVDSPPTPYGPSESIRREDREYSSSARTPVRRRGPQHHRRFGDLGTVDGRSPGSRRMRSEEHTSELQSRFDLVCRLLLEKKNINKNYN